MIGLGVLLLPLLVIGGIVAAIVVARGDRSERATATAPPPPDQSTSTSSSTATSWRWPEASTFLSTQPTLFAVPEEPSDEADIRTPSDVTPLHRSVPVFAEALGYIGGVLVLVALGVIVQQYWSDLQVVGRLAMSAGTAGGLFGLGAILTVERDVALRRLRSFLWLGSAAGSALFAGVVVVDLVDSRSARTITIAVAGAFALQCGLLWRNRFRPLQQAGFVIGFAVFIAAVIDQFTHNGPVGLALWLFGASLVVGGLRRAIVDPTIAEFAGAAIAYAGCAFIVSELMGFGEMLAVTTAWALVAPAVVRGITAERREQILFGVIGALALWSSMPSAIAYFAIDAGIATGLVVWLGGAALIAAGVSDRVRVPIVLQVGGAVMLIIGAAVCGVQNPGFAPLFGMLTAIGLIALGTRPGLALMSLFGSVGLLINVPWTIGYYFPGRGRVPFLILISGLLIIAVAVLMARSGGRIRDEVSSRRGHLRHAA
ncbi:MAG: hypothetical protein F2837_11955 [Actinobacteria bacterium]|uniref:Unannotated protein n=1 Tax=freshwater metagenome TaxID=449393 RepID=A0A6J7KXC2_9ZZZZ|nr:hypothetical protein [Actinomycetota bacterium]